ncbi:MAG: hypothetical protein RMJ44_06350 [Cytophagales bacterium]|nr:hypothetical protein [Bernardetiaceae bacterium]MDW8210691.1 hypothetical protein [Cytophagales bacterium]
MKFFLRQLLWLTFLLAGVMLLLSLWKTWLIAPHSWYLLIYFFVITLSNYYLLYKGIKSPLDFSSYTLGATAVRLLISAAIVGIFFWLEKDRFTRWHFIVTFFVMYFLFTVFEIHSLVSNLRRNCGR